MVSISTEHISRTPGVCGGRACIAGHRIRVMDIKMLHEGGQTPEEIAEDYPSITLADVHAAIAYYLDHCEEIVEEIRVAEELAEKYRPLFPSKLQRILKERADG